MATKNRKRLYMGTLGLLNYAQEWMSLPLADAINSIYFLELDWKQMFEEGTMDHHMLRTYIPRERRQEFQEFAEYVVSQAELHQGRVYLYPMGDERLALRKLNQLLSENGMQPVRALAGSMEDIRRANPGLKVFSC